MRDFDILDQVVQLHNIARQFQSINYLSTLGTELRKIADQISRVHANHTDYDQIDPQTRDYIEYLAHLGE